jgi:hypothetical protein
MDLDGALKSSLQMFNSVVLDLLVAAVKAGGASELPPTDSVNTDSTMAMGRQIGIWSLVLLGLGVLPGDFESSARINLSTPSARLLSVL